MLHVACSDPEGAGASAPSGTGRRPPVHCAASEPAWRAFGPPIARTLVDDNHGSRVSADPEDLKRASARAALSFVESGMVLGLGTGSTVRHLLELLGAALRSGALSDIVGVPTSLQTEARAREEGIDLVELGRGGFPDLTIDGADEVSPELDLVKGMGGALLREKMVAQASRRVVIIADRGKLVDRLGTRSPLPVEVIEWGLRSHVAFLESEGAAVSVRSSAEGVPVRSDNGNLFLDCRFPSGIPDPRGLELALSSRAGIVGSGLFLGIADVAVIASEEGVRTMTRPA